MRRDVFARARNTDAVRVGRANRHRGRASLLILGLVTASAVTGATSATAAGPVMTAAVTSTNPTVATGGRMSYEVKIECSNLVREDCVSPTLVMTAPSGRDAKGASVAATDPVLDSPDVVSATLAGSAWTVALKDMKPGSSITFAASWAVANYVTLSGTDLTSTVTLAYSDKAGASLVGATTQPAAVTTVATTALTAVKTMVSPTSQARLLPNSVATYKLMACIPGNTEGLLQATSVTFVDTFDDASGIVISGMSADAQLDQAAHTVTWTIPVSPQTVPLCGTANEIVRTIEVFYPMSMVPAPLAGGGVVTYPFENRLDATMSYIDGTSKTETSTVNHSFTSDPTPTPGTLGVFPETRNEYQVNKATPPVRWDDTTTEYFWRNTARWGQNLIDNNPERRNVVINQPIPCVENGQSSSRYAGVADYEMGDPNQPFAPAWTFDELSDTPCATPGFRTTRIQLAAAPAQSAATYEDTIAVHIRYIDAGGAAHAAQLLRPNGFAGQNVSIYGAGTDSFNLAPAAIVTDIRVIFRDVIGVQRADGLVMSPSEIPWYQSWGTNTPAFVAARDAAGSPLYVQTNTIGAALSDATNRELRRQTGTLHGESYAFNKSLAVFSISKRATSPVVALKPGDESTWTLTPTVSASSTEPVTPQIVDVLPAGLTYVPGSSSWDVSGVGEPVIGSVTINGVARTTLTWIFPSELAAGESANGTFTTRVGLDAAHGSHSTADTQQAVYMFNHDQSVSHGLSEADAFDLNGDGSTTDRVAASRASWTVTTQSGAVVQKFVRGSQDGADWITDGVSAATVDGSGTWVDYRLNIGNSGSTDLRDIVVYDVLPYVGDHGISADLSGDERHSAFPVTFRELGTLPAGVTVEYSQSEDSCRPELFPAGNQGTCVNDWTSTAPADATSVRSLRFVIAGLAAGTEANLDYRGDVEKFDFAKAMNQTCYADPAVTAKNNLAFRATRVSSSGATSTMLPAEAPYVTVRSICGRIGDYTWFDTNRDGLQDAGEKPAAGVVFELIDGNGDVVTSGGKPVRATTDAKGLYSFAVPLGTWSVRLVSIPKGYALTKADAGDDARDSDFATVGGVATAPVTITSTHLVDLTLDAGLVPVGPAVDIEKYDIDGNDADTEAESVTLPTGETTLTFTITNAGVEPLIDVVVTDAVLTGDATVDGIVCTFPDGTTGVTWAGPFAVGATFDCTANIRGVRVGDDHSDAATVTATGEISGKPVTDTDLYHGKRPPAEEPPVTPEEPPVTPEEPPVTPEEPPVPPVIPPLAATGLSVTALSGAGMLALAFFSVGAVLLRGRRARA